MSKFDIFVERISKLLNTVASFAMIIMMVLVTVNVILRAVFKASILGTYEYTGFMGAILISCGLAYCTLADGHISINILVKRINKKYQKFIHELTQSISLFIMLIYTYAMFDHATKLMKANEVSISTKTPFYIFVYITAISFLVFTLAILTKLIHSIKGGNIYES